jgi:hypothetical protein
VGPRAGLDAVVQRKIRSPCRDSNHRSSSPYPSAIALSYPGFCSSSTSSSNFNIHSSESRDSSVGIALGYGLDDRDSMVRIPAEAGNFSLHHRVQDGSGAHPASYPMGTRGSFPGG